MTNTRHGGCPALPLGIRETVTVADCHNSDACKGDADGAFGIRIAARNVRRRGRAGTWLWRRGPSRDAHFQVLRLPVHEHPRTH